MTAYPVGRETVCPPEIDPYGDSETLHTNACPRPLTKQAPGRVVRLRSRLSLSVARLIAFGAENVAGKALGAEVVVTIAPCTVQSFAPHWCWVGLAECLHSFNDLMDCATVYAKLWTYCKPCD